MCEHKMLQCCNFITRGTAMETSLKEYQPVDWRTRYQNLKDSLSLGLLICDLNFMIMDCNKKYLEMTGFNPSQLIGRSFNELFTESEFAELKTKLKYLRQNDQYQYETILARADGSRIPSLNSSHINRNSEGEPESVNILVMDIRESKEIQTKLESAYNALLDSQDSLKKEKKMIEAILFGIGDCVTIFDRNGEIILGNPQGLKIRGERKTSFLPLEPGSRKEQVLKVDSQQKRFSGKIEPIRDENGSIFAFAEILKDITSKMRLRQREQELFHIRREMRRGQLKDKMIGVSPAMNRVFDLIVRCTDIEFDIVISGETGVGKGMAAQEIHARSSRKDKPFIAVNCGALPESLLESELFGHVKGAFTGAVAGRTGLFRDANGGIIFLNEIGDISEAFQVKLLRVFEEKEVRPVGSGRSYPVDIRIITATNKNLEQMVERGLFREDLYYRLSVIPLHIPPLRERREDIFPLIEHFIRKHRGPRKRTRYFIDQEAQQVLLEYSWPGNIRELENAVKHALAMSRGSTITARELPAKILAEWKKSGGRDYGLGRFRMASEGSAGRKPSDHRKQLSNLSRKYQETEKEMIVSALLLNNGSRTRTARQLGVSRTTLWRKITMYGLDGKESAAGE